MGRSRTVVGELDVIPVDEPGAREPALLRRQQDAVHGAQEPRVVGRDEEHQRRDEDRRVQHAVVLVALHERVELLVVPCRVDGIGISSLSYERGGREGKESGQIKGVRGKGNFIRRRGEGTITFLHDLLIEVIPRLQPLLPVRARQTPLLGEPKTTIERNPQHHLRIHKVLFVVAHLPYAHVRF